MELNIQPPAVFAVVPTNTRTAVKEFVLAPLRVPFAPVALGGTSGPLCTARLCSWS